MKYLKASGSAFMAGLLLGGLIVYSQMRSAPGPSTQRTAIPHPTPATSPPASTWTPVPPIPPTLPPAASPPATATPVPAPCFRCQIPQAPASTAPAVAPAPTLCFRCEASSPPSAATWTPVPYVPPTAVQIVPRASVSNPPPTVCFRCESPPQPTAQPVAASPAPTLCFRCGTGAKQASDILAPDDAKMPVIQ